MPAFLFDLPKEYYELAVVTDGKFDTKKAAALGYSPAQFAAIKEFLDLPEPKTADTTPLAVAPEES